MVVAAANAQLPAQIYQYAMTVAWYFAVAALICLVISIVLFRVNACIKRRLH